MVKNGSPNIISNFKDLDVRYNAKLGQLESQSANIYIYTVLEWEKTKYQFKVILSKVKQWHIVLPTIPTYMR